MWFYSSQDNMISFASIFDLIKKEMTTGSQMEKWAGNLHGGLVNVIKGYKWFLMRSGLWDKRIALPTTWE